MEDLELNKILEEQADDNQGVYCKSSNGIPRSKWQDGWNAQVMQKPEPMDTEGKEGYAAAAKNYTDNLIKLRNWYTDLPIPTRDTLRPLILDQTLDLSIEDNITPYVNCNDLFWWGCADDEEVKVEDIPLLLQSLEDSPKNGALLYCARKRGMRPQTPYYKYFEGEEHLFDACGESRELIKKPWWRFWG